MLQRLARLLVVLLAIATLALIAVWVVTNTEFGRERVRRYALGALARSTHGLVRIGGVRGNLLGGATITGISITDSTGRPFLKADSLSGRYSIGSLIGKRVAIKDLVIYRPEIVVERLPGDTAWNYRRLWPRSRPTPGDTIPGFGSWIRFDDARIVEGHLTVRSPWSPRAGITARARDSLVKEALSGESRLMIAAVPGGYVKVVELRQLSGHFPLVQLADPSTKIRMFDVASLHMQALPFRPPPPRSWRCRAGSASTTTRSGGRGRASIFRSRTCAATACT
jgi:hypothetical protein